MAASTSSQPPAGQQTVEWPALRVRDTFLDYFEKNGHTFGMAPGPVPGAVSVYTLF